MSESLVDQANAGVDNREAIDKLSQAIFDTMIEQNPSMEVLFQALASNVVGFSMQYVHSGTGGLAHQEVTTQLARFYAYCVDLAAIKIVGVNAQLAAAQKEADDAVQPVRE